MREAGDLSAGVFDISVPYTMTLSGVLCTYAIVNSGQSVGVAILIALVASVIVGIMNGLVVVTFKIDSDASKPEIEAIVAQSQKRSAVYDVITNPVNVTVEVV